MDFLTVESWELIGLVLSTAIIASMASSPGKLKNSGMILSWMCAIYGGWFLGNNIPLITAYASSEAMESLWGVVAYAPLLALGYIIVKIIENN